MRKKIKTVQITLKCFYSSSFAWLGISFDGLEGTYEVEYDDTLNNDPYPLPKVTNMQDTHRSTSWMNRIDFYSPPYEDMEGKVNTLL